MRKALKRLLNRLHAARSRTFGGSGAEGERTWTLVRSGLAGSRG